MDGINTDIKISQSKFIKFLIECQVSGNRDIPPLSKLSKHLNMSVSSLREQMEVARNMGLIEVKTRTGIKILDYSFSPSVIQSILYSIQLDRQKFLSYLDLRKHLEAGYWFQAASLLTVDDINGLRTILERATEKLYGNPSQIPHKEHRDLHLSIYKKLENPFVLGLLEAFWELYESTGLNLYTDKEYLNTVWQYHRQIIEALEASDLKRGYQVLLAHMDLINHRATNSSQSQFE
jgi:DNA-binding FadR family transcriptional regulator